MWIEGVGPVETWRCCRDWPIAILFPVGRCGLCEQRPTPRES
jgi:hypothetical protein